MRVKEIMTASPWCCTPETTLQEVARMMANNDCGAIPVVETRENMRPIGIVTDRDITCRTIAEGASPLELTAADCMSEPAVTVGEDAAVQDCCETMERYQVRRVPVVDSAGGCCGIVAQADIARRAPMRETAEVVKQISQPAELAGT